MSGGYIVDQGLATIIRTTLSGIVVVRRRDGVILEANEAFAAALGWRCDELIGRTTDEIALYVDPATRAQVYEAFERDGVLIRKEVMVRTRAGAPTSYLLTMHELDLGGEACAAAYLEDVSELRRVDAALQRSQDELRAMFEFASVGISQIDLATRRFVRVNPTMCEISGYTADELYGMTIADLTHPDDRAADAALLAKLRAEQSSHGYVEKRYVRKDGRIGWCSVDTRAVGARTVAVVVDITARRDADAARDRDAHALAEAEERSRLALDTAELGTWRHDIAAGRFQLDACAQHQFGLSRDVVSDTEMFAAIHPEDRTRLAAAIAAATAPTGTGRATVEHRIDLPGDQQRWLAVHVRVSFAGEGAARVPQFAIAACRDITAARAAAEALRVSEDRYRNLVDNLDDMVYSLDLAGRITFVSRAVARFGYDPAQMIGRPVADFIHPDDLDALHMSFARRLTGAPEASELRWLDAAGKTRHVRTSSRPLIVDGRLAGITGLATDVTAQREVDEKMRAAQRMEAIGRLAGGVAHDFNNILSVILSCAELAAEGLADDDPLRSDLAEIDAAATRAAGLTRQLLAFSRRQVLAPERVDLGKLVASLSSMLRRLIGEDVELHVEAAPELFPVVVDKGQLEQVVMNLAVNARDAMPEGGVLRIQTRNTALDDAGAARVELSGGDFVELVITDTGTGIPDAVRDRIFEPFFTTKAIGKGTGLGLSMVHGIVKQSGGGIALDSELGRGTAVHIFLPRDRDPRPIAATRAARGSGIRRGHERILLVEDEATLRDTVQRVLIAAGYEVIAAANATEALRVAEREGDALDLVLTDVVMPGINGRLLAERLRPLAGNAKVLFMSGHTDEVIEQYGIVEVNLLRKPFEGETLTTRVRSVLDAPR